MCGWMIGLEDGGWTCACSAGLALLLHGTRWVICGRGRELEVAIAMSALRMCGATCQVSMGYTIFVLLRTGGRGVYLRKACISAA